MKIVTWLSGVKNLFQGDRSRGLTELALKQPVLVASAIAVALLVQVRQLGCLESWELAVFDRLVQSQQDTKSDSRLLVVAITEADIQHFKQWPLSDRTIAQVLAKLQQHHPKVIGLDLYRDIPQQPGNQELLQQLKAKNVVAIAKLDDGTGEAAVPPPPNFPKENVGFNDIVIDPDGVVRRNLMFASTGEENFYSFALRLSLSYLSDLDMQLQISPQSLQIGKTTFVPLEANSGGYEKIDAQGYQVLLQYHSPQNIARQVTVTQVLEGKFSPEWVKGKIILVGTTAPSAKDLFFTPYSVGNADNLKMPGVIVHAQMVSQILGAVLDKRSLFWFLTPVVRVGWIWCWAIIGGVLARRLRHPLYLTIASAIAIGGLWSITCVVFTYAGWIPIVEPGLALVATCWSVIACRQVELQIANKKLSSLVSVDGLTQIANRRRFDEYFYQEWQRLARQQDSMSLILCDVDCFKLYNDTYGHQSGDLCLQQVAQAIGRVLKRPADLAARYGGEEFVVVLPNTNVGGAVYIANAIQKEVKQLCIPHSTSSAANYVTLSIGISTVVPTAESAPSSLIAAADKALYEAKAQGRNRAIISTMTA